MGIELEDMRAVLRALKLTGILPSGRMLVLGSAIIHFGGVDLKRLASQEEVDLKKAPPEILTLKGLGGCLGFNNVETLDINGLTTITHDLTLPLPKELIEQFDLVVDAGVLFWVSDPGRALSNIFHLCSTGGIIVHITAVSGYYGRGYWNIHPRLFEDFYLSTNAAKFLLCSYRCKPRERKRNCFALLTKIAIRLNLIKRSKNTTWYYVRGHIYLSNAKRKSISFSPATAPHEADMIPNNVIGTFGFQKLLTSITSMPKLISNL